MIEIMFCVLFAWGADCDWTLILDVPLGDFAGMTFSDRKTIYMAEWNACVFAHEYNEHALKPNNTVIHKWSCP